MGQEFKYRARNRSGRHLYQAIANASKKVRDSDGPFEFQIPRFEVFFKNLLCPLERVLVPNDFETKLMSIKGINYPYTIFEILMESSLDDNKAKKRKQYNNADDGEVD